jgi:hypothetical protein
MELLKTLLKQPFSVVALRLERGSIPSNGNGRAPRTSSADLARGSDPKLERERERTRTQSYSIDR